MKRIILSALLAIDMEQLGCLFLIILIFVPILLLATRKKKLRPPGPWRLPLIGNLHLLDPNKPHRSLLTLSKKHGPLMLLHLGSIPTLVISSHNIAEEIFRNHDLAFSSRPPLTAAKKLLYNFSSVTFLPYGDLWREARKISMLELLSLRRVRSFETVRLEEVSKLMDTIKELSVVNMSELTLSLANNIVCRAALGDDYGGGKGYGRDVGVWLHEVLSEAQRLLGGFWVGDYIPAMAWVDRLVLGLHAKLEKNFEEFNSVCDEAIREHLKPKEGEITKSRVDGKEDCEDMLHSLLRLHKVAAASDQGRFLSAMDHVKGLLVETFIAGTDTSSATIVWTMTELMRNPQVMLKLQQELEHADAHRESNDEPMIIHESELEKLQYLKLVIKESLRLHPPAPLLVPRETIEPCEIYGYAIPTKTRVLINAVAISTDPEVWEKPLEFWPERFNGSEVDFRGQHFQYLPFGAGRRKCPGMSFALVLVELTVANLVRSFDWSLPNGIKGKDISMDEAIGITVHKKDPLLLVAKSKF